MSVGVFEPILRLLAAQTAAGAKALWPDGPTVAKKSAGTVPLDDYLLALTALEDAYVGVTPGEIYQRLRRLYYSKPTGGAGKKFDLAIGTNEFCKADLDRPVVAGSTIAAPLALDMLNLLFGADAVTTPSGALLDPSHWYAPLDLKFNGLGTLAGTSMADVPWSGLFTWVGDLSSWWVEWETKREGRETGGVQLTDAERKQLLNQSFANRVTKEDLLADMDAQIIAKHLPQGMRLSAFLRNYYGAEANPLANRDASTPNALNRFHYFVDASVPALPARIQTTVPFRVALQPEARTVIFLALRRVIEVFETGPVDEEDITHGMDMVSEIASRAMRFLQKGLETGNPNWPNP
jgi:hypothetical protein